MSNGPVLTKLKRNVEKWLRGASLGSLTFLNYGKKKYSGQCTVSHFKSIQFSKSGRVVLMTWLLAFLCVSLNIGLRDRYHCFLQPLHEVIHPCYRTVTQPIYIHFLTILISASSYRLLTTYIVHLVDRGKKTIKGCSDARKGESAGYGWFRS
jgi:hypothetical protein